MEDLKLIGQRIRQLRQEKNMTQDELAKKLGYISRSTINQIELGRHGVHNTKLMAFAAALNTTIPFLLGVTDNPILHESKVVITIEDEGDFHIRMSKENAKRVLEFAKQMFVESK